MKSTARAEQTIFKKQQQLVDKLIEGYSKQTGEDGKGTEKRKLSVADLIRLLQLQREMEKERSPDIIEVRWIDPK